MMGAAFALYIAFESGARSAFDSSTNKIVVIGPPNGWFVYVFLGLRVFGFWAWLASFSNSMPLFGRNKAMDPECEVSLKMSFVWQENILFVSVENRGETANFTAQFSRVEGLVHESDGGAMDPDYFGKVAWEDTVEDRQVLGSKAKARLATLAFDPRTYGCRFRLPHSAMYRSRQNESEGHLQGLPLRRARADTEIAFDLTIINETKIASKNWRVSLLWDDQGDWQDLKILAIP